MFKFYILIVSVMIGLCNGIDFYNCGSSLEMIDVEFEGCSRAPCEVYRDQPYNVAVIPEYLDPVIDRVDFQLTAKVVGATFPINDFEVHNPCIVQCPLKTRLFEPRFNFTFSMFSDMIPFQSLLTANATFRNGNTRQSNFCVQFYIQIY